MNPLTQIIAISAAVAIVSMALFYEFVRIPHERAAARSDVLIEVKDQQLRAQAKADQDRKAAQEKITAIEADYFARQSEDAAQIQTLNEAIANVEKSSGSCPGGLPIELRNVLNGIGAEAVSGDNPAIAAPIVRPASRASKRSPVERHSGALVGQRPPVSR